MSDDLTLTVYPSLRYGTAYLLERPRTAYYLTCRHCGEIACWAIERPTILREFGPWDYPNCMWLDGRQMTRLDRWACGSCGSTAGPRFWFAAPNWG